MIYNLKRLNICYSKKETFPPDKTFASLYLQGHLSYKLTNH